MIYWNNGVTLEEVEKQAILLALKFWHGNKTKAAESLGISARTISNKLVQYGMEKQEDGIESDGSVGQESNNDKKPDSSVSKEQTVSMRKSRKVQEVLPE